MAELSILIPSRNEEFLARTVEDLLEHIEGDTEILVGLDGQWASVPDHPRVKILYTPTSIGQRAMTNQLARLSKAKYVMKVDAHCSFDQGFDVKMMADMQDDFTMVAVMKNLHAFNWVCENGHERYQGPSGPCQQCGKPTTKDVIWYAKPSPNSKSYCFDRTLHFQYFREFEKRPEGKGDLTPSMSLQGSLFMMTRAKYWELDICDEAHGSWGQQGVEVACKTWLSGGQVIVNQKTWYAHMFRTQGGDFGFPYEMSGKDVDKTRKYSRELWLGNNWPLAKHDLQWLLDKFAPVPGWEATRGIIYYTDNQLNLKIAHRVQRQLRKIAQQKDLSITSASLKPMEMGKNVHLKLERGVLTYFKQIVAALEASEADIVYFCEHDVLYHESHFDFVPPRKDKFYYNQNVWRVRTKDGLAVSWEANQVAELACYRQLALDFYRARLAEVEQNLENFNRSYEPGGRDKTKYEAWRSEYPNIDIRHGDNLTKSKWSINDFSDKSTCVNWQESTTKAIPGWDLDWFEDL